MPTFEPVYALEPELGAAEFMRVLRASGLAQRRPVDDPTRIKAMLANAQLAPARAHGVAVDFARAIADCVRDRNLSDFGVDRAHAGRSIGRALITFIQALRSRKPS